MAAGEDAVGDFEAAGEDFSDEAALPWGVGVGGVEAGAVAQLGLGFAARWCFQAAFGIGRLGRRGFAAWRSRR